MYNCLISLCLFFVPGLAFASPSSEKLLNLNMVNAPLALVALGLFVIAYILVMTEEITHLRKSKPVVLVAGVIWVIVAYVAQSKGLSDKAMQALDHGIIEYAELFLFLLVAMTYVNALEERLVFEKLRSFLVSKNLSYRQLFWVTGILAFFISPIADNLTTALLMCAVIMAVGANSSRFVTLGCINVVVAANAGGAFSPFGDITTLMVWQAEKVQVIEFFDIFVPSVVSYVIPAAFMTLAIPHEIPTASENHIVTKLGAKRIAFLFGLTIVTTVCFHHFLRLPPMLGMMTGLGYLNFFSYYLKQKEKKLFADPEKAIRTFDIFNKVKRAEWDTLFFFYGVIFCVGGLAVLGYLELLSHTMYHMWGTSLPSQHHATPANVAVGILSAIIDNIPVMYAVLTMDPTMSHGQWLLVTLTAGIGGSLLSIGSAAGVALMGQSKGQYTFFSHLKWTWAIALGYVFGIACHIWMNHSLF